jgi:hypothetical protein
MSIKSTPVIDKRLFHRAVIINFIKKKLAHFVILQRTISGPIYADVATLNTHEGKRTREWQGKKKHEKSCNKEGRKVNTIMTAVQKSHTNLVY